MSSTSKKVVALNASDKETIMIQFLFRKSDQQRALVPETGHPREENSSKQWTNKLASLVEDAPSATGSVSEKIDDLEGHGKAEQYSLHHTSLRLEGPYFTPVNPASYHTVICLVAGTGISGAIAIASAFSAQFSRGGSERRDADGVARNGVDTLQDSKVLRVWPRCIVLWSVRESDYIKLPFFSEDTPGLEVRPHLTGNGRSRLDPRKAVEDIRESSPTEKTWVYISGPNPFIDTGERACRALDVAYFGARWS